MNKKEMENKLRQAFSHASDGLFQRILTDCKDERRPEDMKTSKVYTNDMYQKSREPKRRWSYARLAATAAAFVLVLASAFAIQQGVMNRVATVITMDLNPSIQLDVNSRDKVLEARSLNDDGANVLDGMELKNTELNVAINAIIGSMLKNGYLTEDLSTFLVSVDNRSDDKSLELGDQISAQLENVFSNNGIKGMILNQNLKIDDDVEKIADEYMISTGKAYLVMYIHEKYETIPVSVLAEMSITELSELFSSTIADDDDIRLRGNDDSFSNSDLPDRASILTDLFEKWQFDLSKIRSASIELDDYNDRMVYKIEIGDGENKIEVYVDPETGEVLATDFDDDDDSDDSDDDDRDDDNDSPDETDAVSGASQQTNAGSDDNSSPDETDAVSGASQQTTSGSTVTSSPTYDDDDDDDDYDDDDSDDDDDDEDEDDRDDYSTSTSQQTSSGSTVMMLSAAEARKMVTDRFGGIIQKIEYTYDDSYPMYKGEALKKGYKVVFEINAATSAWSKWDVDNDNSWDSFSASLPDMITMNQAVNSVKSKSGNTDTFVQKIDFLWDDSEPTYQGEAFYKGVKYSFEIYAYSGNYRKWDMSSGDDTWAEKYYNVR